MSGNTSHLYIKVLGNVNLSDSAKDRIEEKMCLAVKRFASEIQERFGVEEPVWVVM
jgi:hypothetical protein